MPPSRTLSLLLCAHAFHITRSSLIASTAVTRCVVSGGSSSNSSGNATSNGSRVCIQRVALSLTVAAGQDGTENFATGDIDALTAEDGSTYAPSARLSISVSKSAVRLIYPLRYTRDYNAGPREIVLLQDGAGNGFNSVTNKCVDDPSSAVAACGWAVDAAGAKLPSSNGFCCSCPGFLDSVFGVHHTGTIRGGGLNCGLLSHPQSAHCLRFSGLWYQAFEVLPHRVGYDLTLYLSKCPPGAAEGPCEAPVTIAMSPSVPGGCASLSSSSASCDVSATLEGDFAAFEAAGDYSSKLLMVPKCRDTSDAACLAREAEVGSRGGAGRALLIDKSTVTPSGDECNKVGVSYQAFNSQADPCWIPRGSCLSNQLNDMYASDLAAVTAGRRPSFFVDGYKDTPSSGFTLTLGTGNAAASSASVTMQFESRRYQKSLVSVVLPGSSVGLTWTLLTSPAAVSSPSVAPFEGASGSGVLSFTVTNAGAYKCSYTVSLSCSSAVLPAPAQSLTLAPGASSPLSFRVYAQSFAAATHACSISVVDELQHTQGAASITFNTTALQAGGGSQSGVLASGAPLMDSGSAGDASSSDCDAACGDSVLDLVCFIRHACGSKLAGLLGGSAGVLLGVVGGAMILKRIFAARLLLGGTSGAAAKAGLCTLLCRPLRLACCAVRRCVCPPPPASAAAPPPLRPPSGERGRHQRGTSPRPVSGARRAAHLSRRFSLQPMPVQADTHSQRMVNPLVVQRIVYLAAPGVMAEEGGGARYVQLPWPGEALGAAKGGGEEVQPIKAVLI